jgi:hypothetical protein
VACGLGIRENGAQIEALSLPDRAALGEIDPAGSWMLAPGRPAPLPDVPAEMLIGADFEAGAWMLDAQLARTESIDREPRDVG